MHNREIKPEATKRKLELAYAFFKIPSKELFSHHAEIEDLLKAIQAQIEDLASHNNVKDAQAKNEVFKSKLSELLDQKKKFEKQLLYTHKELAAQSDATILAILEKPMTWEEIYKPKNLASELIHVIYQATTLVRAKEKSPIDELLNYLGSEITGNKLLAYLNQFLIQPHFQNDTDLHKRLTTLFAPLKGVLAIYANQVKFSVEKYQAFLKEEGPKLVSEFLQIGSNFEVLKNQINQYHQFIEETGKFTLQWYDNKLQNFPLTQNNQFTPDDESIFNIAFKNYQAHHLATRERLNELENHFQAINVNRDMKVRMAKAINAMHERIEIMQKTLNGNADIIVNLATEYQNTYWKSWDSYNSGQEKVPVADYIDRYRSIVKEKFVDIDTLVISAFASSNMDVHKDALLKYLNEPDNQKRMTNLNEMLGALKKTIGEHVFVKKIRENLSASTQGIFNIQKGKLVVDNKKIDLLIKTSYAESLHKLADDKIPLITGTQEVNAHILQDCLIAYEKFIEKENSQRMAVTDIQTKRNAVNNYIAEADSTIQGMGHKVEYFVNFYHQLETADPKKLTEAVASLNEFNKQSQETSLLMNALKNIAAELDRPGILSAQADSRFNQFVQVKAQVVEKLIDLQEKEDQVLHITEYEVNTNETLIHAQNQLYDALNDAILKNLGTWNKQKGDFELIVNAGSYRLPHRIYQVAEQMFEVNEKAAQAEFTSPPSQKIKQVLGKNGNESFFSKKPSKDFFGKRQALTLHLYDTLKTVSEINLNNLSEVTKATDLLQKFSFSNQTLEQLQAQLYSSIKNIILPNVKFWAKQNPKKNEANKYIDADGSVYYLPHRVAQVANRLNDLEKDPGVIDQAEKINYIMGRIGHNPGFFATAPSFDWNLSRQAITKSLYKILESLHNTNLNDKDSVTDILMQLQFFRLDNSKLSNEPATLFVDANVRAQSLNAFLEDAQNGLENKKVNR